MRTRRPRHRFEPVTVAHPHEVHMHSKSRPPHFSRLDVCWSVCNEDVRATCSADCEGAARGARTPGLHDGVHRRLGRSRLVERVWRAFSNAICAIAPTGGRWCFPRVQLASYCACLLQQHSGPQLRHPLKLTPFGSAPANYRTFPVAGPWVILSCVRCFRFSSRSPMHSHVRRLGDSACACCTGGGT